MSFNGLLKLPQAGEYQTLLADPPWSFVTYSHPKDGQVPQRAGEQHYETLGIEALSAMPVGELAANDCALFMWVVDSHLEYALALGRGWGFTYKTVAFTWMKVSEAGKPLIGLGYWSRKGAELCLLFTRGKPKRLDRGVRQVICAPRREHSRKPDEQYELIERLVEGPRAELFARQRRAGWDAWGNEPDKFDTNADALSQTLPADVLELL